LLAMLCSLFELALVKRKRAVKWAATSEEGMETYRGKKKGGSVPEKGGGSSDIPGGTKEDVG